MGEGDISRSEPKQAQIPVCNANANARAYSPKVWGIDAGSSVRNTQVVGGVIVAHLTVVFLRGDVQHVIAGGIGVIVQNLTLAVFLANLSNRTRTVNPGS